MSEAQTEHHQIFYPDDMAYLIYAGYLAGVSNCGVGQSHDDEVALEAARKDLQPIFDHLGIDDFHEASFGFWRVILEKFGNDQLGVMSANDRQNILNWQEEKQHKCTDPPDEDINCNNEYCCCCGFSIYVADGPCPLFGSIENGYLCAVCNERKAKQ
jgi:hypothetical protein